MPEEEKAELLKEIANRVRSCVRDTDMVTRLDETKFAIVVSPVMDSEGGPELLTSRLFESLEKPILVNGGSYQLKEDAIFMYRSLEDKDPQEQLSEVHANDGEIVRVKDSA